MNTGLENVLQFSSRMDEDQIDRMRSFRINFNNNNVKNIYFVVGYSSNSKLNIYNKEYYFPVIREILLYAFY